VRLHEKVDARRVEERQPAEVEHDLSAVACFDLAQLGLDGRDVRHLQFALESDHVIVTPATTLDAEPLHS